MNVPNYYSNYADLLQPLGSPPRTWKASFRVYQVSNGFVLENDASGETSVFPRAWEAANAISRILTKAEETAEANEV
jgi:hypothetical protein